MKIKSVLLVGSFVSAFLPIIPLTAHAQGSGFVCVRNNNSGALIRGTYHGVSQDVAEYTTKQWTFVPGEQMLLQAQEFIKWGNNQIVTPNSGDLIEIEGMTTKYSFKVYPNQCSGSKAPGVKPTVKAPGK